MTVSDKNSISVKHQAERSPYRLREQFLSTPELALLRVLQRMVGHHYLICPKVALNDIFYIVRPNENVHFFNKFFRKHVDFLLCEPDTLKPAFGIELVKPVTRNETREADQFMGELFLSARLPLVHMCPICGRMMVLRIFRDGKNMGKQYYGCIDSPRCSGVVEIS
jgi:hypothetical protein